MDFSRSGLEDAPPLVRRGWLILGAVLAAAMVASAVILGTGIVSADQGDSGQEREGVESELRAQQPEETDRREREDISRLTVATGACRGIIRDERNADSTGGLGIPPAAFEVSTVYEHEDADYAAVVVTDGGLNAWCAATENGLHAASYDSRQSPKPLIARGRVPLTSAGGFAEVHIGEVARDVDRVQIEVDGELVGLAHVDGGYFSAPTSSDLGAAVQYVVTFTGGQSETLDAARVATSSTAGRDTDAGFACLSYLNITVAEPEPHGNRAAAEFDSAYELIAEHTQPSYALAVATDGDTITACLEAWGLTWVSSEPDTLPAQALITPLEPPSTPSDNDETPLVGRVADSVTAVTVVTADGKQIETHLEDGFYAALLPAGYASDVTYVIQEADGDRSTVGAESLTGLRGP
ncbi:MAG: hypothetical protein WBG57_11805 [Ornithinimicrobium sp.]